MKIFIVSLVSFLIITGFFGCKKNAQVEEPALTGCAKHAAIVPKVITNGVDYVDNTIELTIDTTGLDKGLYYYWQLPNGTLHKGPTYKINELKKEDRGTYYAYYSTDDSCKSYKSQVTLKVEGLSLINFPCEWPANYLELNPLGGARQENMTQATFRLNGNSNVELKYYRKGGGPATDVTIELSEPEMVEGVYKMTRYSIDIFQKGKKYAFVSINTGSSKWYNLNEHLLYVVKNKGVFEIIICSAPMSTAGAGTTTYPLDAHLTIK